MVSHKAVLSSLDAYADGTLPDSERARVAAHLQTCAECGANLRQIHRFDHVLNDMPAMEPVPFSRFWSRLEPKLPSHAQKRAPLSRPARLAAGFALAIVASLVGVVALASDDVMPNNPLYVVKHARQNVQLVLTDPRKRPALEIYLSMQRIQEANAMLKARRDDLAVASLRDVPVLLGDAARLEKTPADQPDSADVTVAIARLKTELGALSATNREPDGSTTAEIAAVDSAVQDAQSAVSQAETSIDTTTPPVVDSPPASPVTESATPAAAPSAEASAAASASPSPEVSPSATTGDAVPTDATTPAP